MSDAYIESEPSRRAVTDYLDKYTRQSAEVAQNSFAVFRRAIHPGIKWEDFVARLTRELQQFGEALEAGGRPKLALCTAPQHGKSLAAEDFAAWISGRNPNFKTIYASYSEDLGTRMSLNLQRLFRSRRYHDIFPHIEIDEPGWVANPNLTEFAYMPADAFVKHRAISSPMHPGRHASTNILKVPASSRFPSFFEGAWQ
jgi:hypothetical protein